MAVLSSDMSVVLANRYCMIRWVSSYLKPLLFLSALDISDWSIWRSFSSSLCEMLSSLSFSSIILVSFSSGSRGVSSFITIAFDAY